MVGNSQQKTGGEAARRSKRVARAASRPNLRVWARRIAIGLLLVFVALPVVLTLLYAVVPVPATPLMVIRLFEGEGWSKDWVPLEEISPHMARSVIAAEDNRFCEHSGFDFEAIQDAIEDYQQGKRLRGASTISMQTAKNLFLWPGRSFIRKGLEAYLTPMIELVWSKRRIIEVYLNIAEWGGGVYGIEAAAQQSFGKPAAKLSRRESALLASVLPNPRQRSAAKPSGGVARKARSVERRIGQLGPLLDCVALEPKG